ncbi:MAG TPA: phosphate acyltransferase [Bacteroidales bacterium]|jgi:phosphate butyryltransferase|nr:phosphate acetyltransferase [Bacteroidales bacterium]HNR42390.1 phosphate acyltransferase [Bacteroidales bacterium]HPM18437.1 phosphate acyltransferase [Bacteroidales bacterium]HQG77459.1 phosphate acyltransferase [Bacteroidales bacterium]
MIRSLDQMVAKVLSGGRKYRIAVAWAHDDNTILAIRKAVEEGIAEALLTGRKKEILKNCQAWGIKPENFTIIESDDEVSASADAVKLAKTGDADIVMKGLAGTSHFLKAVMDKEKGLMLPGAVLSYVGALQLPAYNKLLFITDPAVIPFPGLEQKIAMAEYAIEMTSRFGIEKPKIALIGASEKPSRHFESSAHYEAMKKMAAAGQISTCIMDGPLDIFLACDRKSVEIKGVKTPVDGDADILLFPSLESSNPFYKGLMLFAGGELGGLIRGTEKPVVLMSRSESEKSKFYCIALACFMA